METKTAPSIALFAQMPLSDSDRSYLLSLSEQIALAGMTAEVPRHLADVLPLCKPVDFPSSACRMVMSIGGDGTFLKAARWTLQGSGAPVAGINAGTLGFLTAWERDDARRLIKMAAEERVSTRERSLLKVHCEALGTEVWPLALNELALLRSTTAQMITVSATLDGSFLADYTGDGLIISTPTGSTGYNLSAGGPILMPETRATLLTPVAPHSLTQRPLVICADSRLALTVSGRASTFMLSIDGLSFTLPVDAEVRITPADQVLRVVHNPDEIFVARLRAKLMWGQNPVAR